MTQMVLPQNLPNKAPSEASGPSGSSRSTPEKSGESQFDAVSRSEQKRLDAERAEKSKKSSDAEDARQAERAEAKKQADKKSAEPDTEKQQSVKDADARADAVAETPDENTGQKFAADDLQSATDTDSDISAFIVPAQAPSAPVTFAGLQSLAMPTAPIQPQSTGTSATGQAMPFVQGSMMSLAGMSANGKGGSMTLQTPGQNGSVSGGVLSEALLAGVTGDGAKASDSPMLQNAVRFQGALESVSAQANSVNTPKMAPDAPILRGYTTSVDVPVSHAEWGDKVAGKLSWLTARNMSVAEIHLTPPDMGPMEVKVQVQQEQATITVQSANPVVREQLELHSHRLRDMLSEQGISLEQFDVSDSGREQAGEGEAGGDQGTGEGLMADSEHEGSGVEPQSLDLAWKGEVDIFA